MAWLESLQEFFSLANIYVGTSSPEGDNIIYSLQTLDNGDYLPGGSFDWTRLCTQIDGCYYIPVRYGPSDGSSLCTLTLWCFGSMGGWTYADTPYYSEDTYSYPIQDVLDGNQDGYGLTLEQVNELFQYGPYELSSILEDGAYPPLFNEISYSQLDAGLFYGMNYNSVYNHLADQYYYDNYGEMEPDSEFLGGPEIFNPDYDSRTGFSKYVLDYRLPTMGDYEAFGAIDNLSMLSDDFIYERPSLLQLSYWRDSVYYENDYIGDTGRLYRFLDNHSTEYYFGSDALYNFVLPVGISGSKLEPFLPGYNDDFGENVMIRPIIELDLQQLAYDYDVDFPGYVPPTPTYTYWTQVAEPFDTTSHTGDSWQDAYEIKNAYQLAYIAEQVNDGSTTYSNKYFKQVADIDLNDYKWRGIGSSSSYYFAGFYDGQYFKIENFNTYSSSYQGLFGNLQGGQVKNIIIQSGTLNGSKYTGGIAGYCLSATITNCINNASISGGGDGYAGGICGSGGTIENCVNFGAVKSTGDYVGGICGSAAIIKNCVNYGNVDGASYVGGIEGYTTDSITNCISHCTLTASGDYVGGLLGGGYHPTMTNCSAYGQIDISGSGTNIGSIWGGTTFYGIFDACSFVGTSNKALSMGIISRTVQNYPTKMTACYQKCNNVIQVSSNITTDSSTWEEYWSVVEDVNGGLPIQKGLYFLAEAADSTAADIAKALSGFQVYS